MDANNNPSSNYPPVPLTLEGASILHQMFRIRWGEWKSVPPERRGQALEEAAEMLGAMEQNLSGQSAFYSVLGHKADIMAVHFRRDFEELNHVEWRFANLALSDFLEPATSYLSVVELGLYESTVKLQAAMAQQGVGADRPEFDQGVDEMMNQQRRAMAPRLWPDIPDARYVCFYPMDKRRGESKNWYTLPLRERQRMMNDHGLIGRKYGGRVKQIISGSIGFDDWEWGVDLFSDDPLVFKQLIYEMRFDEASALYALFGSFYIGRRFRGMELDRLLQGRNLR